MACHHQHLASGMRLAPAGCLASDRGAETETGTPGRHSVASLLVARQRRLSVPSTESFSVGYKGCNLGRTNRFGAR